MCSQPAPDGSELIYKLSEIDDQIKLEMGKRTFRLWDAIITHNRVVFRSPIDQYQGWTSNIDVLFTTVEYLNVPSMLTGLSIEEATEIETEDTKYLLNGHFTGKVYVLKSSNHRFLVAAGSCFVMRNELSLMITVLRQIVL